MLSPGSPGCILRAHRHPWAAKGVDLHVAQGEVFGLTVDRVDFLRRTLTVDRQLVGISGRVPFFGPPKTAASVRVIPLPTVIVDGLAAHLAAFPTEDLGHANAAETLDTYSHLWPDSDDRTREAVDLVLADFLPDSMRADAGGE